MWVVVILHLCLQSAIAWDPDAGLDSLEGGSFLSQEKTSVHHYHKNLRQLVKTIDGDPETFFESVGCLPFLYTFNPDSNALMNACETPGACKSTNLGASLEADLNDLTDGWTYTELKMEAAAGATGPVTIDIPVPKPQQLQFVNIYAWYGPGTTYLRLYNDQDTMVHEWALTEADKEHPFPMEVPVDDIISRVSLEFDSQLYVKDISAIGENGCHEEIIWEMDQERELAGIKSLHHAQGEGLVVQIYLSTDNVTWTHAVDLPGESNSSSKVTFTPTTAKFIKLVYKISFAWHIHGFIYEVQVFGPEDENGGLPTPTPNPATLRDMFGVNGEWGWGTGQDSSSLEPGEGASIYSPLASHARNVHAMDWDVTDPDNTPDYDKMAAGGGTEPLFWLNWDTEYAEWVNAKMTVDASIGFSFPPSEWDTPDVSAHAFGENFSKHFGSSNGNGLVSSVEVGNEPDEYDAAFYNTLLKYMAKGLKDGDDGIVVLPAALQADNRLATNYIGTTVSEDITPFLDALNYHQRSFVTRQNGLQVGTYPENPASDFNLIKNMIKWRDANLPGKPIWITQWGWDSPGAGQKCLFPECVSETAAATYATRGLLIQARLGIERSYWYDHANHDCDDDVGCRSGLTGDTQVNFEKKETYIALQGLLDVMGDVRFLDVIQEGDQAYVYAFGNTEDGTGNKMMTHIVAWRPVDIDADHNIATVSVSVDATPVKTFCQDDTGFPACPERQPSASSGGTMSLDVSPRPMIVQVQETSLG